MTGGFSIDRAHTYDIVCLSLEPWDDVWRRNQFFATELLAQRPDLRMLFVEQPVDIAWSLAQGHRPQTRPLRAIGDTGRLWAMTPRKWLPRRVFPAVDRSLRQQVLRATQRLLLRRPVLWINDSNYAPLADETGWPTIYDVTDDWLLARGTDDHLARQRRNDAHLVEHAAAVVVCSPNLAASRGKDRVVNLIPNGVDVDHFRRPRLRPSDLPPGRIVLYTGTLIDGRLDVDLCVATCRRIQDQATLVLLGPNCLSDESQLRLGEAGACILGARPYQDVPAYMQHADVLVVPHINTPFTESLDPIKAREVLAIGRPTVSTPVAGFRELSPKVTVAESVLFPERVDIHLRAPALDPGPGPLDVDLPSWKERAAQFLAVLDAADAQRRPKRQPSIAGPRCLGRVPS